MDLCPTGLCSREERDVVTVSLMFFTLHMGAFLDELSIFAVMRLLELMFCRQMFAQGVKMIWREA